MKKRKKTSLDERMLTEAHVLARLSQEDYENRQDIFDEKAEDPIFTDYFLHTMFNKLDTYIHERKKGYS